MLVPSSSSGVMWTWPLAPVTEAPKPSFTSATSARVRLRVRPVKKLPLRLKASRWSTFLPAAPGVFHTPLNWARIVGDSAPSAAVRMGGTPLVDQELPTPRAWS